MTGRLLILSMLGVALAAGAGLYYAQVYAYYRELTPAEVGPVAVVDPRSGAAVELPVEEIRAIDSDSSPIRFRACFQTGVAVADLAAIEPYPDAQPLVAPGWFDCFDARAIGAMLELGEARAWLARPNVTYGIDRVLALSDDGRGWMWHQINPCGEVVFDGAPAPDDCPPLPRSLRQ